VLDNLQTVLLQRPDSFRDMDEYTEACKSIYDDDPILKQFNHIDHRTSLVDLHLTDTDDQEPNFEIRGNVLSRRSSSVHALHHLAGTGSMANSQAGDEFDHVVNVSVHDGESLYAYHYLDENDKTVSCAMEVAKVTCADSHSLPDEIRQDH